MSPRAWRRTWLAAAGVSGAISIALAAYGSHRLSGHAADLAKEAALYQLVHAAALLAIAALVPAGDRWLNLAGALFVLGTLGFSGGLYAMALFDTAPVPLIPIGGTCLIAGWLALAMAAFRPPTI